nr:single-stranded-DNA-specific exonuclease RecJ [Brackiella oedipodis]
MVASIILETRPTNPKAQESLQAAGVAPILARLFAARGIEQLQEVQYDLRHLLSPGQLLNCQKAAQLLADAIAAKKSILIVADYDCDGATACAIGLRGLSMFGANVDFMVPNRFETGYGLSPAVIEVIQKRFDPLPDLIVTVDNGIASIDGVAAAKALGIDVIVTDHHLPADEVPEALTIVNPNQKGCQFPSKSMAGCGVIFYVLIALRAELRQRGAFAHKPEPNLNQLTDIVALGTVADVVKLDANNRILVSQGLRRMRNGQMAAGIKALFDVAGADYRRASTMDLGYKIGPRINAAGRLQDMSIGIHCLLTDNYDEAFELATQLNNINLQRRSIESHMNEDALEVLENNTALNELAAICVYEPGWHQGVIGLVASRLKEKFWKPVFAFARGDDHELRGSGRSVPDVHLRDALDWVSKKHPKLLLKFGGHSMAAGLSILEQDLPLFRQALHEAVVSMTGKQKFEAVLETDGPLDNQLVTVQNAQLLQQQVWGTGFPNPVFCDVFRLRKHLILKEKHSRLVLEKNQQLFEAIWFNHVDPLPEYIEVAYELDNNEWQGLSKVQLLVRHATEAF